MSLSLSQLQSPLGAESSSSKSTFLKDLLTDDDNYSKFLAYIRSGVRDASSNDVVKGILTEFGGVKAFSSEFTKWLKAQTQPFLTVNVIDSSASSPEGIQQLQQPAYSSKTSTLVHSEGLVSPAVKVKKRMTPSLVSSSVGTGNITSIPSSTMPFAESVMQASIEMRSTQSPSPGLRRISSADPEIFALDAGGSSSPPTLFRSSSVGTTVFGFSSPLSPRAVPLEVSSSSSSASINRIHTERLSELYCALIFQNHVGISNAIQYIAKIASVKMPLGDLVVRLKDQIGTTSVIQDSKSYKLFISNCLRLLCPLLCSMGSAIPGEFSETEAVRELAPDIALCLKNASEAAYENDSGEDTRMLNRDLFLKPFRDDIDSRHEYKNHVENRAYNERESCFDQFSELFKKFQTISKSDMNGRKTGEFWTELHRRGEEIIKLGDYNFSWFSDLFVAMLTFHGPNMITVDSVEIPKVIKSAMASSEKVPPIKSSQKVDGKQDQKAQLKQKKLEERLGLGGKGYIHKSASKGIYASSSQGGSQSPPQQQQNFEYQPLIEEPSQFFPGQQQFFYRFIVLLDSHRLSDHLTTSIFAEIRRLIPAQTFSRVESAEDSFNSDISQSQQESYVHRIVKLKILGKFLGLLHFWPQWTTLLDRSKMGPLQMMTDEGARKRHYLRSPLDLVEIIEKSFRFTFLSLTVPWVTEYLRMMTWSSSFKVANPHKDAISFLHHIYKSKMAISFDREVVPSNRLYAFIELELFFDWIPSALYGKVTKALPVRNNVFNPVDDQNLAFTVGFLKYVLPELHLVISRLRKEAGLNSAKQTIDISAPVVDIQPKVLKRQTPSLVVSIVSPKALERPITHSPIFKSLSGSVSGHALSTQSSPAPSLSRATSYSLSSPSPNFIVRDDLQSPGTDQRASDSFWQQHPHLYQVCHFVIDYHNTSCHERLRDKTAEAVREFWTRSADIKCEISFMNQSHAISSFQESLSVDMKRVFARLVNDGESFLNDFLQSKISKLVEELCSLYPCHPRVGKLAAFLIKKQISDRHSKLLSIFSLFSKRKLEEVLNLSIQQVRKQTTQRPKACTGSSGSSSFPNDLYDNPSLRDSISRLKYSFNMLSSVDSNVIFGMLKSVECHFDVTIKFEEATSEVKMLNMISSIALDLTEFIIAVASLNSSESSCKDNRTGENIYRLILAFLLWVNRLKGNMETCFDFDGMVFVEMSKFFSTLFPVLMSIDHSCRLYFEQNGAHHKPSNTILKAEELHLLFSATIYRALASSSKRSILKYFENARYIRNLSSVYLDSVILFVEYILSEKGILKLSGYTACDVDDWLNDPSVRRQVKINISSDFSDVITMLSKMKVSGL